MEHGSINLMTPFDHLTTTRELQMMKLMFPYTPASMHQMLAMYIKFQELQVAMRVFEKGRYNKQENLFQKKNDSPITILEDMRPFMSEQDQSSMDMVMTAFSMMDMMNSVNNASESKTDPMDMMKHMLNPEQQEMFETYNTMFAAEVKDMETMPKQEGDDDSERLDEQ